MSDDLRKILEEACKVLNKETNLDADRLYQVITPALLLVIGVK